MSILTTVRVADAFGVHLKEIPDYASLSYVLNSTPGGVGVLELTLPRSVNTSLLLPDGRLGVWRSISGRPPYLDNGAIYLIRSFEFSATQTFIRAEHATKLLDRRIIAYAAGSTYTSKGPDFADDLIKEFVNQNMLAGIVSADRDGAETQADVSAYLSKQGDLGLGATLSKAAARRTLLAVAQELAEASTTAGTYLTFEIIAPTESTLELRTYATVRGVDHRATSGQPIILREQAGVLENAKLTIDYTNERTFIIAGGQGEQTNRLIQTASDATRMGVSPFGRNEDFRDMSNVSNTTALQDDADAALWADRPLIYFTGNLIETPALTRGIQFDLGDMLTVEDPQTRQQYDVRLDIIHESITNSGGETSRNVDIGLRSIT